MKKTVLILSILAVFAACNNNEEPSIDDKGTELTEDISLKKSDRTKASLQASDKDGLSVIADTVTYAGLFKASTEEESLYMNKWLKNLKLKEFADIIFEAIYSGKLTAYGYGSEMEMTLEEVRELESEHSRNDIAKILFDEAWYFDESEMKFYKEVQSIMLAYERRNSEKEVRGYTAGIKVYFNNRQNK